jgi:hypothetical protein
MPAGTVEQHVGGKICYLINELSDATEEDDLRQVQDRVDKVGQATHASSSTSSSTSDSGSSGLGTICYADCGPDWDSILLRKCDAATTTVTVTTHAPHGHVRHAFGVATTVSAFTRWLVFA